MRAVDKRRLGNQMPCACGDHALIRSLCGQRIAASSHKLRRASSPCPLTTGTAGDTLREDRVERKTAQALAVRPLCVLSESAAEQAEEHRVRNAEGDQQGQEHGNGCVMEEQPLHVERQGQAV
jgi:hypothetical protein